MPLPSLPPTPAVSTEIHGEDQHESIDDFTLPPAALQSTPTSFQASYRRDDDSSVGGQPLPHKRKRRKPTLSADMRFTSMIPNESRFTLPPPPSRSRKIIQVQPEDAKGMSRPSTSTNAQKKAEAAKATVGNVSHSNPGAPKKTAASRKTARKTAHSIIERRRRSKMNDEFETLKELVPAARGQNMHKLAILQAGIDYLRYLEDCVAGLQAARESGRSSVQDNSVHTAADRQPPRRRSTSQAEDMDDDADEDGEPEEEEEDDNYQPMDEDEQELEQGYEHEQDHEQEPRMGVSTPRASRPTSVHGPSQYGTVSTTPSPAIYPISSHISHSSLCSSSCASPSCALSTGSPSPAILPMPSYKSHSGTYPATAAAAAAPPSSFGGSNLPSPALLPQIRQETPTTATAATAGFGGAIEKTTSNYYALQAHAKKALAYHGQADQEVIATLAMMGTERRRSQEERARADGTRGMSVSDLLST